MERTALESKLSCTIDSGMSPAELVDTVQGYLRARPAVRLDAPGYRRAAVLVPLLFRDGDARLLLTQRTEAMPTHKGQVSFPGGSPDVADRDALDTALRETHEEIGIEPRSVSLLGQMDDISTLTSSFIITPFVGVIPAGMARIASDREVARLLEVPLSHLLQVTSCSPSPEAGDWRCEWDGAEIWGATARILTAFLGILTDVRVS